MVKLGTYCINCGFYDPSDKSCDVGYLDKFKKTDVDIHNNGLNDSPIIDRVCPARRDPEWVDENGVDLEKLKDEMYLFGTILIVANSLVGLRSTLNSLSTIDHISNFKFLIVHKEDITIKDVEEECSKITYTEYRCIQSFNDTDERMLFDSFRQSKNGYLFIIDSDKDFDHKMIDKINHAVNNNLTQVMHVEGDGYHQSVTLSLLYKHFKGDLLVPIGQKLREISEEQSIEPKVFTWEQINEQYSNQLCDT